MNKQLLIDNRTLSWGTFIIDKERLYKILLGMINEKNDEKLLKF